jgi:hypothetical protein
VGLVLALLAIYIHFMLGSDYTLAGKMGIKFHLHIRMDARVALQN